MVAEICSRFGGYPSDYIKKKTLKDMYYDHKCFLELVNAEIREIKKNESKLNGA